MGIEIIDKILAEYGIRLEPENASDETKRECIKVNGMNYLRDTFITMMEGVWDGEKIYEYMEVGFKKETRPKGIKPIPYIARRILIDSLEEGWSDYLYSANDDIWLWWDRERQIWHIVKPQIIYRIFLKKWYQILPQVPIKQNYEILTASHYKNFATICGEDKETIYLLPNQKIIPFKNGAYEWEIGVFRKYRKDDFIFQILPRTYIENYDPAIDEPVEFDSFLDDILPLKHRDLLKRIIYAFIGSLLRGFNIEQWILMLISKKGGTGKGTLTTILKKLLGEENVVEVDLLDLEEYRHATSYILGKRLILASETESDQITSLKMIKRISGGDSIPFNPKFGRPFSKKPIGQLLITTNNVPVIDPTEKAFWRRPIIINLDKQPYTYEEYKKKISKIITKSELDKIANKAIRMLDKTMEIKNEYHSTIDNMELYDTNLRNPVFEFFEYILTKDPDGEIFIDELRDLYKVFLEIEKIEDDEIETKAFEIRFSKMLSGFLRSHKIKWEIIREKDKDKIRKKWKGIRYKEQEIRLLHDQAKHLGKKFYIVEKLYENITYNVFNF